MNADETPKFNEWAIVELYGHSIMAGLVSEQMVAGQGFIRVDVPETDDRPAYTRLLGPNAIYALNPTNEGAVQAFLAQNRSAPIAPYIPVLRQLPVRVAEDLEDMTDDDYEDPDADELEDGEREAPDA